MRRRSGDGFTHRYADAYPMRWRGVLRHGLLSGIAWWSGQCQELESLRGVPRVQFLMLHHVFADEVQAFRSLLGRLRTYYRFVSYSEAVRRIASGQIDDAYLAISLDDGLRSGLTAASILQEFGARACFFVCPSMLGPSTLERVRDFCHARLGLPPCEFLRWKDLELLQSRGHEIGGHTMHHPDMARIGLAEAESEIGLCHELLKRRCGPVRHFAWPFGEWQHFSVDVARLVFRLGFSSCASGVRGCHGPDADRPDGDRSASTEFCVHRDQIVAAWPFSHIRYFLCQSARRPLRTSETWPPRWDLGPDPTGAKWNRACEPYRRAS